MSQTSARFCAPVMTHRKPNGSSQVLKFETRKYGDVNYGDPRAPDRRLASGQEPPLGAHIVKPRGGYIHYGIYVGRGNVAQYRSLPRGLRRGPVEEVALTQFAQGYPVWARYEKSPLF
jgi:hypothetical protein